MGFFQICAGVILLQLSKSSKDVPDTKVLAGDLDQIRTAGEQEQPESEPKADAIRGTAAIIRRISQSRQKMEAEEAKRVYEDRLRDQMEPIKENEQVQWDGVRRRKTVIDTGSGILRTKTLHPPLGLTKFPSYDEDEAEAARPATARSGESHGFLQNFRRRTSSTRNTNPRRGSSSIIPVKPDILPQRPIGEENEKPNAESHEMAHIYGLPPGLAPPSGHQSGTSSRVSPGTHTGQIMWADGSNEGADQRRSRSRSKHIILTPSSPQSPSPRPIQTARRQFSFQNMFSRNNSDHSATSPGLQSPDRRGIGSRGNSGHLHTLSTIPTATEEERLGLVHGDSSNLHLEQGFSDEDTPPMSKRATASASHLPLSDSQHLRTQVETLEPPRSSRPSTSLPDIRRSTELGRATDRPPRQVYESDDEGEKDMGKRLEVSSGRDKDTGGSSGAGAFL